MIYVVEQTKSFGLWLSALKDERAKFAIARRIERAFTGNLGDCKSLGDGLCELRINVSAGYRVYFIYRGKRVLLLLAGGDKSSQSADILKAKQLAKELK
ncbi:type II toxin-antitoxin system RelE/ParE family toxin [Pseudomonas putida]|uniref:type II toxin-antitoxin system RelE/ParE family toxin n=1 Tax=Pseudomonas putida TaxID=303 RepID=UPI0009A1C3B1|nr:type II toxin-antitoxin system RelE/ParE family toxin [Pseudomonas putida]